MRKMLWSSLIGDVASPTAKDSQPAPRLINDQVKGQPKPKSLPLNNTHTMAEKEVTLCG